MRQVHGMKKRRRLCWKVFCLVSLCCSVLFSFFVLSYFVQQVCGVPFCLVSLCIPILFSFFVLSYFLLFYCAVPFRLVSCALPFCLVPFFCSIFFSFLVLSHYFSFLVLSHFVLFPCGLQFCLCAGRMRLWPCAVSSLNMKPYSCPAVSDHVSCNSMIGGQFCYPVGRHLEYTTLISVP